MTLPDEQIIVNVALTANADGTVNLSFTGIAVEDLPALLCSVGTEEFQTKLVDQLREEIANKEVNR